MRDFAPKQHRGKEQMNFKAAARQGHGESMPTALRSHFEARFFHDFGRVRIHPNDVQVQAQGAVALTHGWEIAFAPGQWNIGTRAGQRLLAHELAHVVQQTRPGSPIEAAEAEGQANQSAEQVSAGGLPVQLGSRPFGTPAAQTPKPQPTPTQPQVVPGVQVEKLAAEIERVVTAHNLPGTKPDEIAAILTVLRDYGKAGKVTWGQPATAGVYGEYDDVSDTIILSSDRFNISNPGHIAMVVIFHEASHAMRWRTGGALSEAIYAADISRASNDAKIIKANIEYALRSLREETQAHDTERGVRFSYAVEVGSQSREEATKSIAEWDATAGSSAQGVWEEIEAMLLQYYAATGRDLASGRFEEDAKNYARTGVNMPDVSKHLL